MNLQLHYGNSIYNLLLYSGLEIGGITSPNANHFWGNCESLWQSVSPNFLGTVNHFLPIANHFSNGIAKGSFFHPHPFFNVKFSLF